MENQKKRVGIYAVSGVLIAALIVGGLSVSGIQFPLSNIKRGTLIVLLTDAPVELKNLNLTITNFSIHYAGSESWIDMPFANGEEEVYF